MKMKRVIIAIVMIALLVVGGLTPKEIFAETVSTDSNVTIDSAVESVRVKLTAVQATVATNVVDTDKITDLASEVLNLADLVEGIDAVPTTVVNLLYELDEVAVRVANSENNGVGLGILNAAIQSLRVRLILHGSIEMPIDTNITDSSNSSSNTDLAVNERVFF